MTAAFAYAVSAGIGKANSPNFDNPDGAGEDVTGTITPDGTTTKGNLTIKYGSGLDKLEIAVEEYDTLSLFDDLTTDEARTINVSIDNSIDAFMEVPNSSTVYVNANVLKTTSSNMVASGFGHELVHVRDYISGSLNRYSSASIRASEARAYSWQFSTRQHFNLSRSQKTWVMDQIGRHR